MVSDNLKNLMLKYEDEYKDYQAPVAKNRSLHQGYSFQREGLKDSLDMLAKNRSELVSKAH